MTVLGLAMWLPQVGNLPLLNLERNHHPVPGAARSYMCSGHLQFSLMKMVLSTYQMPGAGCWGHRGETGPAPPSWSSETRGDRQEKTSPWFIWLLSCRSRTRRGFDLSSFLWWPLEIYIIGHLSFSVVFSNHCRHL